jgi:ribosomal protein L7/L12
METVESQLRAALRLSLGQWSQVLAGKAKEGRTIRRGRRIALLEPALAPIKEQLDTRTYRRLKMTLSILLGIEALVVLKDIWGLSGSEAKDVIRWASQILLHAAKEEAQKTSRSPATSRRPGIKVAQGS